MGKIIILDGIEKNPITKIGSRAGICYGTDTKTPEKNYKRGLQCIKDDHGRVLELVDIEMILEGYSARVMREWYTHIGGAPTRLQASTRYISYDGFEYITPRMIEVNDKAKKIYDKVMESIDTGYKELLDLGIKKEDAANLLPIGMTTTVVDKRNLRNLIDMNKQRTCSRAYWEYQVLMLDIKNELRKISDEWAWIVDNLMVVKCDVLEYCPEKYTCGRWPKKEEL